MRPGLRRAEVVSPMQVDAVVRDNQVLAISTLTVRKPSKAGNQQEARNQTAQVLRVWGHFQFGYDEHWQQKSCRLFPVSRLFPS